MKLNVLVVNVLMMMIMITVTMTMTLVSVQAYPDGTIIEDGWTVKMSIPTARSDFIPVTLNGEVYIAGGCITPQSVSAGCSAITNIVEKYNFANDKWVRVADMPRNRTRYAAASYNNNIIVIVGGRDLIDNTVEPVDIYFANNNTWSTFAQVTGLCAFSDPWAFTIGSSIYVTGGYTPSYNTRSAVLVMNMNQWPYTFQSGIAASLNYARGDIGGAVVNNKAYIYGGWNESNWCVPQSVMEVYDPIANQWNTVKNSNVGRGDMGIINVGNKVVVSGGETKSSPCDPNNSGASYSVPIPEVEIYDIASNTWSVWSPIAFARFRFGTVASNSVIYNIAGMGPYQNYSVGEEFPVLSDNFEKDTLIQINAGVAVRVNVVFVGLAIIACVFAI